MDPLVHVLTPATNRQLVTREAVVADLEPGEIAGREALVDALILAVGEVAAGPEGLRRPPWRQRYEEHLRGPGDCELLLARYPVAEVEEVLLGSEAVDPATYRVVGDPMPHMLHRKDGWPRTTRRDLVVTYSAGWDTPAGLPEAVRLGALLAVKEWLRGGLEVPLGVVSDSDAGGSTRYRELTAALPAATRAILRGWR